MNYLQQNYMQPNMYQPQAHNVVDFKDYLGLSIFNFLCCGILFGILALICSCQARDYYMNGNIVEGRSSANWAKIFNIIGITIGSIVLIIFIILLAIGASIIYST